MKNTHLKKIVSIAMIISALSLTACGTSNTTNQVETDTTTTTSTTEATTTEIVTTTEDVTTTETEIVTTTEDVSITDNETVTGICALLKTAYSNSGNVCVVEYDEDTNTYYVYTSVAGIKDDVDAVKNGTIDISQWNDFLNVFEQSADIIYNEVIGIDDTANIVIKVIDDQNKNTVLLNLKNNSIVYDAVNNSEEPEIIDDEILADVDITTMDIDASSIPEYIINILQSSFDNVSQGVSAEVEYDETKNAYTIYISIDGLAQVASMTMNGELDSSVWEETKTNLLSSVDICQQSIQLVDDTANVIYVVVNDQNTENQLLVISNGQVSYDCLQD